MSEYMIFFALGILFGGLISISAAFTLTRCWKSATTPKD